MTSHFRHQRRFMPILIAFLALAWFTLGSALHVIVASATGKKIEIVVCSGAGVKKITVALDAHDEPATTIKHCGNAPLVTFLIIPGEPAHLHFQAPDTVASWHWMPSPLSWIHREQDNRPPPGRAPPASPTA